MKMRSAIRRTAAHCTCSLLRRRQFLSTSKRFRKSTSSSSSAESSGDDLAKGRLSEPLKFQEEKKQNVRSSTTSDMERQIDLEMEINVDALNRNLRDVENMMDSGIGAELRHAITMIKTWINPLTKSIQAEQRKLNDVLKKGDTESDDAHIAPYLVNEFVSPEEIAYLTVIEVVNSTLKEKNGVNFVKVVMAVASRINELVYQTRKAQLKKSKRQYESKGLKQVQEDERQTVHVSDPLQHFRWPTEIKAKIGSLLVELAIQSARAPEWWLDSGMAKWDTSNESRWYSDLKLPSHLDDSKKNDPREILAAGEKSMQKHGSFRFPMWNPCKVRPVRQEEHVFEHDLSYTEQGKLQGSIKINPRVRKVIEQVHALSYEPKHYPMLVEPREWKADGTGGYLTFNINLVKSKNNSGAMQRSAIEVADINEIFKGLNAMSKTPWKVNNRVYEVVKAIIERGGGVAGIPPGSDLPLPEPPKKSTSEDEISEEERSALKKYDVQKQRIETENANRHSLRCDLKLKMTIAQRLLEEEKFYFPFNLDFRGRTYPVPPLFNHMGSDVNRGMLLFAEGRPLGSKGIDWLKIHLANLCGVDKISFKDRVIWANEHLDIVSKVVKNPMSDESMDFWLGADCPFQCVATCYEIMDALSCKNPEAFISHLPTHQDGSCNGLQHYAALGRDEYGGASVNLTPADKPQDVYSAVLDLVLEKLEKAAEEGDKLATILRGHVNRKVVKQTVMTSVYGVTFIGAKDQIKNRLREKQDQIDWGKDVDVEDMIYDCSRYLAGLTLGSITDLFNCAKNIMSWLGDCSSIVTRKRQPVCWVTPLGLPIVQPYRRDQRYEVKTTIQRLSLIDKGDELPINISRHRSAFPPNFVHSLDSSHMLLTAIQCRKEGLHFASVHDSYWTHAGTMDRMNEILREEFINLYTQPILENLAESFQLRFPDEDFPPLPARGNLDLQLVRDSKYFFA